MKLADVLASNEAALAENDNVRLLVRKGTPMDSWPYTLYGRDKRLAIHSTWKWGLLTAEAAISYLDHFSYNPGDIWQPYTLGQPTYGGE